MFWAYGEHPVITKEDPGSLKGGEGDWQPSGGTGFPEVGE